VITARTSFADFDSTRFDVQEKSVGKWLPSSRIEASMALRMSQAVVAFNWTGIQPASEGDAIVQSLNEFNCSTHCGSRSSRAVVNDNSAHRPNLAKSFRSDIEMMIVYVTTKAFSL
jgi:hypothetical protein